MTAGQDRFESTTEEGRRATRRVVQQLDSDWFRANPHATERWREYIPGEGDSDSGLLVYDAPDELIVRVERLIPGCLTYSYVEFDPIRRQTDA